MKRIVAILYITCTCCFAQVGKVSVVIFDEQTNRLADVSVEASYGTVEKAWLAGMPNKYNKKTDKNGECSLTGHGNSGELYLFVRKNGYYHSSKQFFFKGKIGIGRLAAWKPWNPEFRLYLTKIGNPIPMYAKAIRNEDLPCKNDKIGYDLKIGDWVYKGYAGKHTDIYFNVGNLTTNNNNKYVTGEGLIVSFPNDGDGLIPVDIPDYRDRGMRMPKTAPVTGYQPVLVKKAWPGNAGGFEAKETLHYFLRVNTEKDKDGNIISANYGKIYDDFSGGVRGRISFVYYLNPTTNDTNLEFNRSTNLVKYVGEYKVYNP